MQLNRFNNIKDFWQNAQDCLQQYVAEHNVLLDVLQTLLQYPECYPELPYLAIVQTNNNVLAIAIRTSLISLLLSKVEDLNALSLIYQNLQDKQLPGVSGLVPETEAFCRYGKRSLRHYLKMSAPTSKLI